MIEMSVIIPAYNEEEGVDSAYRRVKSILNKSNITHEIIFINDGSKDKTWEQICIIADEVNSNVKGINFSRNFGKEAAIFAGLSKCIGKCCIVMDCDLQHPPEKIIEMYALWKQGYEIVNGVKSSRGQESLVHKNMSSLFYKIISSAIKVDMKNSSDFKLLDRKVINTLLELPESHVFFRGLSEWVGFRSVTVYYEVEERQQGVTKWSPFSLAKYAINNITSFSTAPMNIVTILGGFSFVFAIGVGMEALISYFTGQAVEGVTTIVIVTLVMGSFNMIGLGIVGGYIAKIFEQVQGRPKYIIKEVTEEKNDKIKSMCG